MRSADAAPAPSGRRWRPAPIDAVLFLAMFFSTWGSGMQNSVPFDVAKLFPAFGVLVVAYAAFVVRKKVVFPPSFNWFLGFYLLHLTITYGLVHPEEFVLGYLGTTAQSEAFVAIQEGAGITCLRLVVFVAFSYAFAAMLWKKERLHVASLGYAAGLLAVLLIGGYVSSETHRVHAGEVRNAGGFLDPNSFGFAGLTCLTLALASFWETRRDKRLKLAHAASVLVGGAAILQSASRSAMIGALLAFTVILVNLRDFSRKLMLAGAGAIVLLTLIAVVPATILESLKERASISRMQDDRGANRLDIWSNYLDQLPHYAATGVGFLRSREVIRQSYTSEFAITHNQYLEVLVETGLLGLLLFLNALSRLWAGAARPAGGAAGFRLQPMVLAMLLSLFVEFMFLNTFYMRDTWILFAAVAGLTYHRKAYA